MLVLNISNIALFFLSILTLFNPIYKLTRTKTSIRYAKENDREERERRKERERKVEGEI